MGLIEMWRDDMLCPFAPLRLLALSNAYKNNDKYDDEKVKNDITQHDCLTCDCAMWRSVGGFETKDGQNFDYGYCGIGGKPHNLEERIKQLEDEFGMKITLE